MSEMSTDITVGFVGMTHLGLVSATACAAHGFVVMCFDEDETRISELSRGALHISEPGLADTIIANGGRQRFSADLSELGACDVVYLATDVPTDDDGYSDLTAIRALIDRVIGNLGDKNIFVVLCQVPPGFTRDLQLDATRLYYQVETLVFGRALERALEPERFIIGCRSPSAPLPETYRTVLDAYGCPVLSMRYESAELAKIAINMCLVSTVSVANTMAELCESVGADWHEIVPALKLDRRIGQYAYLAPGLGIAGGNLERDIATVMRLADEHHTDSGVVRSWVFNSEHRKQWAAQTLPAMLPLDDDPLVAVWGLAYKENTHSTKNSPSLATLAALPELRFAVFDPVVPASACGNANVHGAAQPMEALDGARALMVLTPWPEFREIPVEDIARAMPGGLILDPYRMFDGDACRSAGLQYRTLGAGG